MVHQRAFFSSSSTCSNLALEVVSPTGYSVDSGDSVDDLCTNSPDATSKEVLVLPSLGRMGEEENHPPGMNRDEVVDSSLFRVGVADGSSRMGEQPLAATSSSTDGKWSNESLQINISIRIIKNDTECLTFSAVSLEIGHGE